MKAGIISAGEGLRSREDGIQTPTPLLEVGGVPLIDRAARCLRGDRRHGTGLHRERGWIIDFTHTSF